MNKTESISNKRTYNFYDKIFKYLFSNPTFIKNLIKFSIPEKLIPLIDFNSIKPQKTNFVPKNLKSREADAIYGLKLKNNKSLYIFFLIEFQTYVDKLMPLRLYIYTALFYDELMKQKKIKEEVPIILPIVLYTGDKKWTAKQKLSALMNKEIYKIVKGYAPELKYMLIDKNRYSDVDLKEMKNIISKILYMEKSRSGEEFQGRIKELWKIIPKGLTREDLNIMKEYLVSMLENKFGIRIGEEEIGKSKTRKEVKRMLADAVEDWGKSLIEKGIQKGLQQGIQKGLRQGMRKGMQKGIQKGIQETRFEMARRMLKHGADIKFIKAVTELNEKEIKRLQKDKLL